MTALSTVRNELFFPLPPLLSFPHSSFPLSVIPSTRASNVRGKRKEDDEKLHPNIVAAIWKQPNPQPETIILSSADAFLRQIFRSIQWVQTILTVSSVYLFMHVFFSIFLALLNFWMKDKAIWLENFYQKLLWFIQSTDQLIPTFFHGIWSWEPSLFISIQLNLWKISNIVVNLSTFQVSSIQPHLQS